MLLLFKILQEYAFRCKRMNLHMRGAYGLLLDNNFGKHPFLPCRQGGPLTHARASSL